MSEKKLRKDQIKRQSGAGSTERHSESPSRRIGVVLLVIYCTGLLIAAAPPRLFKERTASISVIRFIRGIYSSVGIVAGINLFDVDSDGAESNSKTLIRAKVLDSNRNVKRIYDSASLNQRPPVRFFFEPYDLMIFQIFDAAFRSRERSPNKSNGRAGLQERLMGSAAELFCRQAQMGDIQAAEVGILWSNQWTNLASGGTRDLNSLWIRWSCLRHQSEKVAWLPSESSSDIENFRADKSWR